MKKNKKTNDRKKYYYHMKVKKAGFKVDAVSRQIDVFPATTLSEIPIGARYYVLQLKKLGYNIQLRLV